MADEKANKESKPVKEKKPTVPTVVSKIKDFGAEGAESREALAKKVFGFFEKAGIKVNSKGKELKEAKVLSLISAVVRDIKQPRNGWWSTFEVVETETEFKITPKK